MGVQPYEVTADGSDFDEVWTEGIAKALGRIANVGLYPLSAATYIIFRVSDTYYRKDGETGIIDDSNADAATLIQAALDAIDTAGGGVCFIKAANYPLTAGLQVGSNTTIIGEGYTTELQINGGVVDDVIKSTGPDVVQDQVTIAYTRCIGNDLVQRGIKVHATNLRILYNYVNGCGRSGIRPHENSDNTIIMGNIVDDCYRGITTELSDYVIVSNNISRNNDENGIALGQGFGISIANNICYGNTTNGIFTFSLTNSQASILGNTCYDNGIGIETKADTVGLTVSHNNCYLNTGVGILARGEQNVFDGNTVIDNGNNGFTVEDFDNSIISNNTVHSNDLTGISISTAVINSLIKDNMVTNNERHGINTGDFSTINSIIGNTCKNNSQEGAGTYHGIYVNKTDNQVIKDNLLIDDQGGGATQGYGVYIDGVATDNIVQRNRFSGNLTGRVFLDANSSGTIFDSRPFQFIKELNGTYETAEPTGILIDAPTERAILQGHLPQELQQVMRLRVFAVAKGAPVNAGGQMRIIFYFNAGARNAAYNTANKSWFINHFDSEETDYVNGDIVTWVVEDADVGNELINLVALDSFELIASQDHDADPDGSTNAVFRSLNVEYV